MKQWEYSLSKGIRKEQSSDFGSTVSLLGSRLLEPILTTVGGGGGGTHGTGCQPIVEIYMNSINAASLMVNVDQLISEPFFG